MSNAGRIGDTTTGHTTYPSQTVVEGSPNVLCNNKPLSRLGDSVSPHTNTVLPFDTHSAKFSIGSPNVLCNNKAVVRVGDGCDDDPNNKLLTGSPNVIIN